MNDEFVMSPGERAAYANGYEHGQNSLKAEIAQLHVSIKFLVEVINELEATAKIDGKTMDDK